MGERTKIETALNQAMGGIVRDLNDGSTLSLATPSLFDAIRAARDSEANYMLCIHVIDIGKLGPVPTNPDQAVEDAAAEAIVEPVHGQERWRDCCATCPRCMEVTAQLAKMTAERDEWMERRDRLRELLDAMTAERDHAATMRDYHIRKGDEVRRRLYERLNQSGRRLRKARKACGEMRQQLADMTAERDRLAATDPEFHGHTAEYWYSTAELWRKNTIVADAKCVRQGALIVALKCAGAALDRRCNVMLRNNTQSEEELTALEAVQAAQRELDALDNRKAN